MFSKTIFRWFFLILVMSTAFYSGCAKTQLKREEALELPQALQRVKKNPNDASAHFNLGLTYGGLGRTLSAITSYKKTIKINPDHSDAHYFLGYNYQEIGRNDKAITEYKITLIINPDHKNAKNKLNELQQEIEHEKSIRDERLRKREKPQEERKKFEALRLAEEKRQAPAEKEPVPRKEQLPKSGSGSGFFVSKMGHVITNAHVVQNCKKITIGDNANKQVPAELINTDKSNDLALLKLSSLEMASAESKSLIQKLGIVVVPLASKGLLRSEDVRLGEKVLVAGYPFGDTFSNTIKVTTGVVSATRGAGDNSGQFQLDAAVQPGNSGGPIYDSTGSIVGVVVAQLNKRTFGSSVENMNFGIKASTVRQFLVSSGLNSKKAEGAQEKSTVQISKIAKRQALMVMCVQ